MVDGIWWRKDLIGGKHLGEEIVNWWKAFGDESIREESFGGGRI